MTTSNRGSRPTGPSPKASEDDQPIDMRRLFPIVLIIFTNILGAGVILPILPLYAEGAFKGTIIQITLLSTAFFGAQFLAAPWLGRLSDRLGRRPVLILSQAGTIAAFILFIFAEPLGRGIDSLGLGLPLTGGMVMLFIARILDGITGGNITTAQAYISDVTTDRQRAQGLGLIQAAFGAGFIFGPAFGGLLSGYGTVAPFIGATIITTGTLLLTVFTLKESLPAEERAQAVDKEHRSPGVPLGVIVSQRGLMLLLLIEFFVSLAFSAIPSTFALYANQVLFAGPATAGRAQLYIGLMLTFSGMMTVITQLTLLRPLVKRFGEQRLLVLGQAVFMLALLGISLVSTALLVTAMLAPFAFGQGVSEPSLQSLVTRFGIRRMRGQLLGLYQSSRSLALIIGPIWAGFAFQNIGPRTVFSVGAGLVLVALALALILRSQPIPEMGAHEGGVTI
jgi:DHA1 family tetracycline resistance protein-like MFS transporter